MFKAYVKEYLPYFIFLELVMFILVNVIFHPSTVAANMFFLYLNAVAIGVIGFLSILFFGLDKVRDRVKNK